MTDHDATLASALTAPGRRASTCGWPCRGLPRPRPESPPFDLWSRLDELLDPAAFRPKIAAGTEWKRFPLRWGNDHAMVANPDRDMHYDLELWAVDILPLMDGTRTVSDIVIERLDEAGGLDPDAVVELIGSLREGRFLDPRPANVEAALQHGLDPSRTSLGRLRTFVKTLRIEWSGIDAFVTRLYRGGFKVFFKPPVAVAAGLVTVAGLLALAATVGSHRFTLETRSAPIESLVLIFLSLTLTAAHELGHALVEIHDGRKIGSAGFMIYFGSPTFYVDASDAMMMDRPMRILQSAAGSAAELFLSGIASLLVFFFPSWGVAEFLYRFALLNLFIIFLNLIPLLELDGYWIFSDLVQVKDLRPRSMEFVQHDLWHKVRAHEHVSLAGVGAHVLLPDGHRLHDRLLVRLLLLLEAALRGTRRGPVVRRPRVPRPADPARAVPGGTAHPRSVRPRPQRPAACAPHRAAGAVQARDGVARGSRRADRRAARVRRSSRGDPQRPGRSGDPAKLPERAADLPPGGPCRRLLRGAHGDRLHRDGTPRHGRYTGPQRTHAG